MIVKGEPRATESNDIIWRRGVKKIKKKVFRRTYPRKKNSSFLTSLPTLDNEKNTHVYLPFVLNLLFYFTFDTRGVGF